MALFLLFAGDNSFPMGGANDYIGAYATLELAKAAAPAECGYEWAHIAVIEAGRLVQVAFWESPGRPLDSPVPVKKWPTSPEGRPRWIDAPHDITPAV